MLNLNDAENGPSVKAVIFTGHGRAFSTGADLKKSKTRSPEDYRDYLQQLQETSHRIIRFPKAAIAAGIKAPLVLKIVCPDILHKGDAVGVWVNFKGESAVRKAFDKIIKSAYRYNPEARIKGVLVAPMAEEGLEIIIGTKIDDQFGPVVMYGLGGIMVEILKDVSFRVLPISRRSARRMMAETKSYPILEGARGRAPSDKKALENLLLVCSDMIEAYPDIAEMDLNPVIVYEKGLSVVDARIILKPET